MTRDAWAQDPAHGQADASHEPTAQTDQEAHHLYEAGTTAFSDGRFEDALTRWREAYELSERPALLYNIAAALDRLGRASEARDQYRAYLEALPEASNANYVRRRLEVIESTDQHEEGAGDDSTSGDGEQAGDAGEEQAGEGEGNTGHEAERTSSPSRAGPIVLLTVAGAAVATAAVTGLMANDRYGSIDNRCTNGLCPAEVASDRDSLRTLTRTTDIMLGVALLSGVSGLVWWLTGGGDDETPEVACGLGGCTVRGRF